MASEVRIKVIKVNLLPWHLLSIIWLPWHTSPHLDGNRVTALGCHLPNVFKGVLAFAITQFPGLAGKIDPATSNKAGQVP